MDGLSDLKRGPSGRLDPQDWSSFRKRSHDMLDQVLDQIQSAEKGRTWTPVGTELLQSLHAPLNDSGMGAEHADQKIIELMPHGVGNTHPRFFGWVHGTGTPSNLLAEMAAAAMNANCGGRNHAAIYVERQLITWCASVMGFPEDASGLVVSGTSMATIVALKVARDRAMDFAARSDGLRATRLVGYTSAETHSCVARAFDVLGLGTDALRTIPVNDDFEIDLTALAQQIEDDKAEGFVPFLVVGTAGTVNTGAVDDLPALAAIAETHGLWFHIDGAFGACVRLSDKLSHRVAGLELADSLAFDFHKWLHVNYEAGCVLVRAKGDHLRAFAARPDYLKSSQDGLAAGEPWPFDYGLELSRGFRALKVWAHVIEHGRERLAQGIEQNCDQAQFLASCIDDTPNLERLAPVTLQICCFRYNHPALSSVALDRLNLQIVQTIQNSGHAAPSTTRIHGHVAIRMSITNHRTQISDIESTLAAIVETGNDLLNQHQ